jgi:ribosome-associated protein
MQRRHLLLFPRSRYSTPMLQITPNLSLAEQEIDLQAIRAQGSGGQNVNKVASAIHLRFDIRASSLPERYKDRLLALSDQRITSDGVVVIKAQQFRTQEMNKENALARLAQLIKSVTVEQKSRKATRPTLGSKRRRMDSKTKRGRTKSLRGKVDPG